MVGLAPVDRTAVRFPATAHLTDTDPGLPAAFRQLERIALDDQPIEDTLAAVAQIAKALTKAPTELSITLLRERAWATAAFTGQPALRLDKWQHELGHGPSLHAAASNQTVLINDMASDNRWPLFAAEAQAAGALSLLSIPLQVNGHVVGSLNLHAETVHAFDAREVALACAFAAYAALALDNAQSLDRSQAL
ncbi:MAG: hypothetical protein JWN61_1986 [Pseudonocardiales bacterium]|nr:hypothetical protein [Pseudonocardiales bacterium]